MFSYLKSKQPVKNCVSTIKDNDLNQSYWPVIIFHFAVIFQHIAILENSTKNVKTSK